MAIMSRKKKAVAQGWASTDAQREEENKMEKIEKERVSEEEHEKRINILKNIGIIKD